MDKDRSLLDLSALVLDLKDLLGIKAAQHVVTHPQPLHNPANFDFFLDSLLKSEFLSFDVISHIVELV